MPYHLHKIETPGSGLKRIAEEEVETAIQYLQADSDLGSKIYQVRRCLKRIRAILRLLQPQLGPVYIEENRRLRDLARRFSTLRDLDVSLELLQDFAGQYKRKSTLDPHIAKLTNARNELTKSRDWECEVAESLAVLTSTRKRIEDWPLHGLTRDVAEHQVRKALKQGRHAFQRARETRAAEDFHELRKSVKRGLNQSRLLDLDETRANQLKQLSQLLGDHHNLAVLMTRLEDASGRFEAMLHRNLRRLETQILELAPRLYEAHQRAAVAS